MAVASTPNQYAQYQWKDDPARRGFAGKIASAQAPGETAQNVAQGAQPNTSNPVTGAAVASPWAAGGNQTSPFSVPGGQNQNPGSFSQMLAKAQAPREANLAAANTTISEMLAPQSGPSAEGQRTLSDLDKQQAEQARQIKEQSALNGRVATGQSAGDSLRLSEKLMTQRADVAGKVEAADAERANQRQQQGLSALLGIEGLGQQAQASEASQQLAKAQLSESARQFDNQQDFQTWATKEGWNQDAIARAWQSQEREASQGFQAGESSLDRELSQSQFGARLGLDQKQLGETIRQFDSRQAFDKWATEAGLNNDEKNRLWNSSENDKQRAFDSGERQLDRAIETSQFAEKLGLDKAQLTEQVRQFDSRQSFDEWAKKLDVSQAEADKIWKANQDDISRKWQSGERLSSQEHEIAIEGLREKADLAKMERNQVLNLATLEQQNKYDQGLEVLRQNYETSRTQSGFSHEEAMQQMQGDLQKELLNQGYTNDQALQASRLEADRIENDRNREFQDKLEFARLAQENNQFFSQFGLDQQRVAAQVQQIESSIVNEAERLGMDKATFTEAMKDAEFSKSIQTAAIMAEKFGDSPEMLEKSTDLIWDGLYKGGLISKDEFDAGKLSAKASTFKDPEAFKAYALSTGANPALVDEIMKGSTTGSGPGAIKPGTLAATDSASEYFDSIKDQVAASVKPENVDSMIALASKPSFNPYPAEPEGLGGGGGKLTKLNRDIVNDIAAKYPGVADQGNKNKLYVKSYNDPYPVNQVGQDFYYFMALQKEGLTEKQAYDTLSKAIGPDRLNTAYKTVTKKDWAA
jgi:hypothetical protein